MVSRLHQFYRQTVVPELTKKFGYASPMAVPTISRIVLNIGYGRFTKDARHQETALKTLERVTGQKSVVTKAKKSISAFKLREGQAIGAKVTLRGERMWEFLDKFINVTLPRVRDFQGIPTSSMGRSPHITIGIREHVVFPEIRSDEVEHLHGVEVSIVTTSSKQAEAEMLLTKLGFPFQTQKE